MKDRKSWAIKDEAILNDLVTLIGVTPEEKTTLAALKKEAEVLAPEMVDTFYERILAHPHTAEYVEGKTDHLKAVLQTWFLELFSGDYDQGYLNNRLKIGQTHVRIGLPVRYPLAMMDVILEFGQKVAGRSPQTGPAVGAFRKLLALDIAIFNHAYEDTQLTHLANLVGNERLARRLLTQNGHDERE